MELKKLCRFKMQAVPGAGFRYAGAYVANVIQLPSFINTGACVDEGTAMV